MAKRDTIVMWQNSYSVGIKLIDEQHMELIRLTNRLFASCMAGQESSKNTFHDIIHAVVDYVGYHFGIEEKVMERVKYPEYRVHKQEHANFVQEVFKKVEEFKSGKIFVPLSFAYYLRDWILHHIAMNDKKVGKYLQMMHKNGQLQKITLMVKNDKTTNWIQIR